MALRRALWQRGLRYRLAVRDLQGDPISCLRASEFSYSVTGTSGTGEISRPACANLRLVITRHIGYSRSAHERTRDRRINAKLTKAGWLVLRFWETDLLQKPGAIVDKIARALGGRWRTGTDRLWPDKRARKPTRRRTRPDGVWRSLGAALGGPAPRTWRRVLASRSCEATRRTITPRSSRRPSSPFHPPAGEILGVLPFRGSEDGILQRHIRALKNYLLLRKSLRA